MASQAKKTILAALVAQITDASLGFGLVEDNIKHTAELSAGDYPACLIVEGGDLPTYSITQLLTIDLNVFIKIIGDADSTIDDVRDFDEKIIDAIHADITIGGTCMSMLVHECMPIEGWSDTNKYLIRRYVVKYRRNM